VSSTRTTAYQQFLQSICENLDQERTKELKILRYAAEFAERMPWFSLHSNFQRVILTPKLELKF